MKVLKIGRRELRRTNVDDDEIIFVMLKYLLTNISRNMATFMTSLEKKIYPYQRNLNLMRIYNIIMS
jgi:hypothetical protein